MRTDDVLSATATGLWHWENVSNKVSLDSVAAGLLGMKAEPVTLSLAEVRARFHVVDFVEMNSIMDIALAEGSVAEGLVRVIGEDGSVLRTVRLRLKPTGVGTEYAAVGTVSEIPPPPAVTGNVVTGDWRRSREAFLLDAGRALAEASSTQEVLKVAGSLAMPGFSPTGLVVFGVAGDRLTLIGYHGYDLKEGPPFETLPLDAPYPAAQVVRTGQAVYLGSREEYSRRFPATWPLVSHLGREAWAFLPLTSAGRSLGAWMAAFSHPVSFTPDERSVLTTVARMLAQALSRTYLRESERALATNLQRTMRPATSPNIPGMDVAARYVPTGGGLQVGGDWYDVIPLPSGRTALVIGDVQGHDPRAAVVMAQLRVALRAYAAEGHHPDVVLSRTSRFLSELPSSGTGLDFSDDRFATCLYLEVDPDTGALQAARAGHPEPVTRLPDGTTLIRPTAGGPPLGVLPDSEYPVTRLVLEPGETLLVCTDGLIETGGHDLESGWARLLKIFEQKVPIPEGTQPPIALEQLADALLQAVHGPLSHHTTGPLTDRREDDIALLLLHRARMLPPEAAPTAMRRIALSVAQTEPARVADARHQLRGLLHDWTDGEQIDGAELMLSEVLTNVLVHTDSDAVATVTISGELGHRRLRVEVADTSEALPHRRSPGELSSSGRGLLLMEGLAGAWGVSPRGEGKAIWFEVFEDAPPPAALTID